jgi:hypothetical protein
MPVAREADSDVSEHMDVREQCVLLEHGVHRPPVGNAVV